MLAAAMAERWLPVYTSFSQSEQWGDALGMRRAMDAVWEHLQAGEGTAKTGETAREELVRYVALVEKNTPHMDDFDAATAPAALATCVMLREALQCCTSTQNRGIVMQALLSGFEAVSPSWEDDEAEETRRWRSGVVQRELKKQLKLIEQIGAVTHFDRAALHALRKTLNGKAYLGEAMALTTTPAPSKDATGRTLISNQTAFEQYRRMIEADLRRSDEWWQKIYDPGSTSWAMMIFSAWAARYSRRRQTLDGTYGPLSDATGQHALLRRNQMHDARQASLPDCPSEILERIEMSLRNLPGDITTLDQPHRYGPSLRTLWAETQHSGLPPLEAWLHILAWARHRPTDWQEADRRKKQKRAFATAPLADHLARELAWQRTDDLERPWATTFDAATYRIRLNDFPDAFLYTLLHDDTPLGGFNDWPENWSRE